MKKTSKVKSVQGDGDYTNDYGTFYKFEYQFEDGTVMTASHKTNNGNFKQGDEVEYEVKGTNEYGSYGKVSKPQEGNYQGGGSKGGRPSEKEKYPSFALSYAKDMAGFHISQGKEFSSTDVTKVADVFLKWLNGNS
jgi:hypothetical protein